MSEPRLNELNDHGHYLNCMGISIGALATACYVINSAAKVRICFDIAMRYWEINFQQLTGHLKGYIYHRK